MNTFELSTFCIANVRYSFSMSSVFAVNDFYIINPASMYFLLDRIYTKRLRGSYIILFWKNIFVPASFLLDNMYKICKLFFQLKENEFYPLEMGL